jgi:hypothetical protein
LFKKCQFVSLKTGSQEKSPLALRADSKKFKLVRHGFEFVFGGDLPLNFFRKAFFNLNDLGTIRADQMMVMAIVIFTDKFKSRRTIAKIKPLHHAHFFEQVHGTVNRRQIATVLWHFGKNFLVSQRMRMLPQNFQNRRARAGDFPRLPAQLACQRGHFLPLVRVGVDVRFHNDFKISLPVSKSKRPLDR